MSWRRTHAVAAKYEPRVQRAALRALVLPAGAELRDALASGRSTEVLQALAAAMAPVWAAADRTLRALLLRIIGEAGAQTSLVPVRRLRTARMRRAGVVEFSFDGMSPEAVRWASQHAAELITAITAEQEKVVRGIVTRAMAKGVPVDTIAQRIRRVVGLTEMQAAKYERLLEEVGYREARRYAAKARTDRAFTIARTETLRASNEGQRLAWQQAKDEGFLTGTETREWITTPDDRLCEICAPLDGEVVGLNEPFSIGVMSPPAHPRCRCAHGLSVRQRTQRNVA